MQNFRNFIIRAMAVSAVLAVPSLSGCGDKDNGEGPSESTFTVPEQPIVKNNYASQNNTITVVASGDVAWTAAKDDTEAEWLTITSASGKGNGNVIFNLAEKQTPGMRSTTVTITGKSDSTGREFSGTVTVQQMGTDPTIVIDPFGAASIPSDANSSYSVAVTSNIVWSASLTVISGGDGWVSKVSPASTTDGNGTVVLSFLENTGEESRQVKLTVASTEDPSVKAELTVTQQKPGERYTIVFEGMTSLLSAMSSTTLTYAPAAGGTATSLGDVDVEVDMTEKKTIVSYADIIPDGAYELRTVGTADVNALFTLAGGIVTYVERWDEPLGQFGGETEARPLKISTLTQLQALASSVNGGNNYSGLYLLQTANIAMSGTDWTPIGKSDAKFSGDYNGGNKEITNFSIETETGTKALFGTVSGVSGGEVKLAVIRNVITRGEITATKNATNVAALAVAVQANSRITGCKNYVNVKRTGTAAGGAMVAGMLATCGGENTIVENCVNYGSVTTDGGFNANNCGGLVGQLNAGTAGKEAVMRGCSNYGSMSFQGNAGGIAGNVQATTIIEKCANYGSISVLNGGRTAGLVGSLSGKVDQCFNLGTVSAAPMQNAGTLIGWIGDSAVLTDSYNAGAITFSSGSATNFTNSGVLIGNMSAATITLTNCYNRGELTVTGSESPAYIFGAISGGAARGTISGCYYEKDRGATGGFSKSAGAADEAGATGLETAAMKPAAPSTEAFNGWNNTTVWKFEAGKYPTLVNNPEQPL